MNTDAALSDEDLALLPAWARIGLALPAAPRKPQEPLEQARLRRDPNALAEALDLLAQQYAIDAKDARAAASRCQEYAAALRRGVVWKRAR